MADGIAIFRESAQRKPSSLELVFQFLILLSAYLFVLNLNVQDPVQNVYATVYNPVVQLSFALFILAVVGSRANGLPVRIMPLGDAHKNFLGIPLPIFAALLGVLIVIVGQGFLFQSFGLFALETETTELVKVSLGSGIMEETFFSVLLIPSLAATFMVFGLVVGLIIFLFLAFFIFANVVSLNYLWVFLLIAAALWLLQSRFKQLRFEKNYVAAFMAALLIAAPFFALLHDRVHSAGQLFDDAKFLAVMNVCNVALGSNACSTSAHIGNNSTVFTGGAFTWLLPVLVYLAIVVLYVLVARRRKT